MNETVARGRRVVVALDPAGLRAAPIEVAARLAHETGAALTGLIVEEERFLRVAALPFTRELSLASGRWQDFGAVDVERIYREHVRRAERLLREVAGRFGVGIELAIERGSFPGRAIEYARPADWVLVDRVPRLHAAAARYRSVTVPFEPDEAHAAALRAAARLAATQGLALRVLLPGADEARRKEARAAAVAILGRAHRAEFVAAGSGARPSGDEATLLVLPDGGAADPARTEVIAVCNAAGCAVMLVRRD